MERPIARIIDPQQVDTTKKEVDGWEAEQKVWTLTQHYSTKQVTLTLLTFEEMVLQMRTK
jgi:hypothetical protein